MPLGVPLADFTHACLAILDNLQRIIAAPRTAEIARRVRYLELARTPRFM